MKDKELPGCVLCAAARPPCILEAGSRAYHHCPGCDLIFLDPAQRMPPLDEVMRYLEHNNDAGDPRYMEFLRRLGDPVRARVAAGARGLDFGCGPATALAGWFSAIGCPSVSYDPLFHPDETVLRHAYDFITCSEVVEHAHEPAALFGQLGSMLKPGALLGVMTRFHGVEAPFERWHYRRDPTHICFYSAQTMRWVAEHFGWELELPVPNVALFRIAERDREAAFRSPRDRVPPR